MGNIVADIEIGARAFEECMSKYGTVKNAANAIGMKNPRMFYRWKSYGASPHAHYLATMARHGIDIHYVLTRRRKHDYCGSD